MIDPAGGGAAGKAREAAPPVTGRTGWDFLTEALPLLKPLVPFLIVAGVVGGVAWVFGDVYQSRVTDAEAQVASARKSADEAHRSVVEAYRSIETISKDGVANLKSSLDLKNELETKLRQSDEILRLREREETARQFRQIEEKLAAAAADLKKARDDLAEAERRASAAAAIEALREELRLVARLHADAAALGAADRNRAEDVVRRETADPASRVDVRTALEAFAQSRNSEGTLDLLEGLDVPDAELRTQLVAAGGYEGWVGASSTLRSGEMEYLGILSHDERSITGLVAITTDRGRIRYASFEKRADVVTFPAEFALPATCFASEFARYGAGPPILSLLGLDAPAGPEWTLSNVYSQVLNYRASLISGREPALPVLSPDQWLAGREGELKAWAEERGGFDDGALAVRRALRRRTLSADVLADGANLGAIEDASLARRFVELALAAAKGDVTRTRDLCVPDIPNPSLDLIQRAVLTEDFRVHSSGVAANPAIQATPAAASGSATTVVTEHGQRAWKGRPGITLVWEFEDRPAVGPGPRNWLLARVSVRDYASAAGKR